MYIAASPKSLMLVILMARPVAIVVAKAKIGGKSLCDLIAGRSFSVHLMAQTAMAVEI